MGVLYWRAGMTGWRLIVGIANGVSGNGVFSQLARLVLGVTEVVNNAVKSCLEFLMRTGDLTYKLRCRGAMERLETEEACPEDQPVRHFGTAVRG